MENRAAIKASDVEMINRIKQAAVRLESKPSDCDALLKRIGDASFVLIGEATHGTHEFYRTRAEITMRLIQEKGFNAVAVEADWPEAYRVHRFVMTSDGGSAAEALSEFKRFPLWMWRNYEALEFIDWLHGHNRAKPEGSKVGFYGLDLYSLYGSIEAVLKYLDQTDPDAARRARYRYACFEQFGEDSQAYGYSVGFNFSPECTKETVEQLKELSGRSFETAKRDGFVAREELFYAKQNALIAKNAEQYYRSMFGGRVSSWNLRDKHKAETLQALAEHISGRKTRPKIVVWEHNSHVVDARFTEMGEQGELNVGQLVRERTGSDSFLIGFTTYQGTVVAASDWDAPARIKKVRPALEGSYENIFYRTGMGNFLFLTNFNETDVQDGPRLERAIGVIYRPETERISHYFHARIDRQFDAIIHLDETLGLEPLDTISTREPGEVPETFPSAA